MPAAPRTDPYVRNYLIRLLPRVQRSRYSISTCRSRTRRYLTYPGTVSDARTCVTAFPLGGPLPSTDSAAGVPVLFVRFAGTMGPSDFLLAFMSALPSETFSDRSAGHRCVALWKPTGSPGSRAWDVCARTGSQTPPRPPRPRQIAAWTMLPSPCQNKIGTRK